MSSQNISFSNGAKFKICVDADNKFIGINDIKVADVALTPEGSGLNFRMDTPDGIIYTDYTILSINEKPESVELQLEAEGIHWGRSEYLDQYNQTIIDLNIGNQKVTDQLTLVFTEVSEEINGELFKGFSYHVNFKSDSRKIHRLLFNGKWGINGSITGNTVLSRGQCNMPVFKGSIDDFFTTACLIKVHEHDKPHDNSFQLGQRGGLNQAFDFMSSPNGIMCQYWTELSSISSVSESRKSEDFIQIVDEYRFELSSKISTIPKKVLFCNKNLQKHDVRNIWWNLHEKVYGNCRKKFNLPNQKVKPQIYEKWGDKVTGASYQVLVQDEYVDHQEMLYAMADKILPVMAEQGIGRFFSQPISESDVSELGLKRKLEHGRHGDYFCASVCATHRFYPAEFWGGMKAWKYFAEKGRKLGIEIGHWFAPHISPRSPILKDHPEYAVKDINGIKTGGGYGFNVLTSLDWNTNVANVILDDLKAWQDQGGLDFLFLDSLSNLGLLQQNYEQGMRTNFDAFGHFLEELNTIGIRTTQTEGISPYGLSQFGITDLRNDQLDPQSGVAGQNDFGWWVGNEDMLYDICAHVHFRKRTEEDVKPIIFKTMAARGYVMPDGMLLDQLHALKDWHRQLNFTYNNVLDDMEKRTVLEDDKGIVWTNDNISIVWAFRDFEYKTSSTAQVEEINGREARLLIMNEVLPAKAFHVYRITNGEKSNL